MRVTVMVLQSNVMVLQSVLIIVTVMYSQSDGHDVMNRTIRSTRDHGDRTKKVTVLLLQSEG
jgi:hypothetical protein